MEAEQEPVCFDDVAVYFSEEEWDLLAEWQKELYKEVMLENYNMIVSLGQPAVISKMDHGYEPWMNDCWAVDDSTRNDFSINKAQKHSTKLDTLGALQSANKKSGFQSGPTHTVKRDEYLSKSVGEKKHALGLIKKPLEWNLSNRKELIICLCRLKEGIYPYVYNVKNSVKSTVYSKVSKSCTSNTKKDTNLTHLQKKTVKNEDDHGSYDLNVNLKRCSGCKRIHPRTRPCVHKNRVKIKSESQGFSEFEEDEKSTKTSSKHKKYPGLKKCIKKHKFENKTKLSKHNKRNKIIQIASTVQIKCNKCGTKRSSKSCSCTYHTSSENDRKMINQTQLSLSDDETNIDYSDYTDDFDALFNISESEDVSFMNKLTQSRKKYHNKNKKCASDKKCVNDRNVSSKPTAQSIKSFTSKQKRIMDTKDRNSNKIANPAGINYKNSIKINNSKDSALCKKKKEDLLELSRNQIGLSHKYLVSSEMVTNLKIRKIDCQQGDTIRRNNCQQGLPLKCYVTERVSNGECLSVGSVKHKNISVGEKTNSQINNILQSFASLLNEEISPENQELHHTQASKHNTDFSDTLIQVNSNLTEKLNVCSKNSKCNSDDQLISKNTSQRCYDEVKKSSTSLTQDASVMDESRKKNVITYPGKRSCTCSIHVKCVNKESEENKNEETEKNAEKCGSGHDLFFDKSETGEVSMDNDNEDPKRDESKIKIRNSVKRDVSKKQSSPTQSILSQKYNLGKNFQKQRILTSKGENIKDGKPTMHKINMNRKHKLHVKKKKCKKMYKSKLSDNKYERVQASSQTYDCQKCGTRFSPKIQKTGSEKTKQNEKPLYSNEQSQADAMDIQHKRSLCSSCCKGDISNRPKAIPVKETYSCSKCRKEFNHRSVLKFHELSHTDEKPFACSQCGKRFVQHTILLLHEKAHITNKPFQCTECGNIFNDKVLFLAHRKTHKEKKPFHCLECGKSFADRTTLVIHQRTHTGEKPFSCKECGKSFSQHSSLVSHERIHTGETPFPCPECEKKFTDRSSYASHMRTHTGERPFKCEECGKRFSQSSNLRRHERIHSGQKPHACEVCGKTFNYIGRLISHRDVHMKKLMKGDTIEEKNDIFTTNSPKGRKEKAK